jgi:MFS family permease
MDAQVRRNFTLGVCHESAWGAAFGLVSPFTILPLAAHALGRSVADAGLMEAALFAGINVPQLWAAFVFGPRFSEPKACAWLHAPCIAGTGLGCLSLVWPGLDPGLRWVLFLSSFIIHWVGMGVVVPSWAALASRNIPDELLGRYFGYSFAGAGAIGVLTAALGAWLVAHGGLAWGYSACCGLAFLLQSLSAFFLSQTRPVAPPHREPGRLLPFLEGCWRQLRSDRALQALLALSFCMLLAGGATQLYTASLKEQGVPDSSFQWLNPALSIGGMLGSYWLGRLFDQQGPARPWFISFAMLGISLLLLLLGGGGLTVLVLAYLSAGLFNAANGAINLPWTLRRAGTQQTALFTGLINTVLAPWWFLAPYALGLLARAYGVHSAFSVAGMATAASAALLLASPSLRSKTPA